MESNNLQQHSLISFSASVIMGGKSLNPSARQKFLYFSFERSMILISHAGCNCQRWAIWVSGNLRWIADILNFAQNANRIVQFSTISPVNMDRFALLKNVATADDVHIKYFHCRQPPACLRSWTQLNFVGKLTVNAWDRLCVSDKCSVPAAMPQVWGRYMRTRL